MKIILIASIVLLLAVFGVVLAKFGWYSIMQILQGIFEKPEKADILNAYVFENSHIEFSYPGNWEIDKNDPSYDPESYFELSPPGNGGFLVMIQDERLVLTALLEHFSEKYRKLMSPQHKTFIQSYGSLEGAGLELRGHLVISNGLIRIFATHIDAHTLIILEQRYDEDEAYNRPGYRLIEKTLRVKRE